MEHFDHVVFACDAETVLKTLENPSWLERRLLSNVEYFDDFCLTHDDEAYMQKNYDIRLSQQDNYFVRTYPQW
jgi:predicted NAD/FAD-binding protein